MFVVNNIASIYSRINIARAIETRIVRSQEAGDERVTDRSIEIGNERKLQEKKEWREEERERESNNGRSEWERENVCVCKSQSIIKYNNGKK